MMKRFNNTSSGRHRSGSNDSNCSAEEENATRSASPATHAHSPKKFTLTNAKKLSSSNNGSISPIPTTKISITPQNNNDENSPTTPNSRNSFKMPKNDLLGVFDRNILLKEELNRQWITYPSLKDVDPSERDELFRKIVKQCEILCSFDEAPDNDPALTELRKKAHTFKRSSLLDCVEYVNTPEGQKIFTPESTMQSIVRMVQVNIHRALPPRTKDFDVEEDEPTLDKKWPHLQVVYELFLRFVVSAEVNAKVAKKYITQEFCLTLINLFDTEDPRERDYLKTILHRIYGKFMTHRAYIRKYISNVFYTFIYEQEYHSGIGELLEILGSIINGFAIPLKQEHTQFMQKALMPLHKPKCFAAYQQQLSFCLIQYVEKDPDTAIFILRNLIEIWPWVNSQKQVLYLNEVEELLELLGFDQLLVIKKELFDHLGRLVGCAHFQVSERVLCLWNNTHLVNSGCLSRQLAADLLPKIFAPLLTKSENHWNTIVEGLARSVQKLYQEFDPALYDSCAADHEAGLLVNLAEERITENTLDKWAELEQQRAAK